MITRDRGAVVDIATINECISEFKLGSTRLESLLEYYMGEAPIASRERTTGLPNNKLMHNFAAYIATMTSGYLIGDPVQYMLDKQPLDDLLDAYAAADVGSVDAEIALSQAILGRGVELVYANSNAEPRTTSLDPQHAFVVYSDDAEHLPLFGVYQLVTTNANGSSVIKAVYVYTQQEIVEYSVTSVDGTVVAEVKRTPHNFPTVPLVEYWNNSSCLGDFEHVTTLIDAYDVLQSDRVNDKEQFADALLVLTGIAGLAAPTDPDDERSPAVRLKQDRVLSLPDKEARAEYLTKVLNEADADVLRQAIKSDIHKFSMVPDLSDENFASNSSGVAMKYKLLGLEQLTKVKERWFREGLRWRLRLFSGFLSVKGKPKIDADKVQMQFRRSLPVNDAEIAQTIATLKGIVPDNLLLAQVPFVEDVDKAMEDLKVQKAEAIAAQAAAFGAFPTKPVEDEEDE